MDAARIGIVGAGLSGLACAGVLAGAGAGVTIFERARGAGGRMSTRRTPHGPFDHGAQYFTAREPAFREAVLGWREAGVIAPWEGRIERVGEGEGPEASPGERFVGVPGMSALLRHLASGLTVRFETTIAAIERGPEGLWLRGGDGVAHGPFDRAVVAVPGPQAVPLLQASPAIAGRVATARLAPCWTLLAEFPSRLDTPLDGVFFVGADVVWAARDSSKPGRPAGERWIVHGHWGWSAEHEDDAPAAVGEALLRAFFGALKLAPSAPTFLATHLWRHALPVAPLEVDHVYDPAVGLGACGDWCGCPRVEGAWLSGVALGRRMLAG